MKVTIKGMTPSTLCFKTLGIIIRGDSKDLENHPGSIARSIDLVNEDQITEVNSLVNAGYITIEVEDAPAPKKLLPVLQHTSVPVPVPAPTPVVEEEVEEIEEVEDSIMPPEMITTPEPKAEEKKAELVAKPRGRGRPKGSKNKQTIKKIKKSANETVENSSDVVVMTPAGAQTGKMKNSFSGEIEDNDRTRASIEAMQQLEDEEAEPEYVIDESKLDPSEQMGRKAIISTGEKELAVEMKQSMIPEAKQIKERGIQWVDGDGAIDSPAKNAAKDTAKDAFVDKADKEATEATDAIDNAFIDDQDDDIDFLEY